MAEALQNPKHETGNTARVRGPNLRVLITRANGVSFQEALKRADKENLVLASNKRMTKALVETNEWKSMREAFACWTGTMAGYSKPEAKLGKFIEYTDSEDGQKYVFPVPEQYRGEKNAILVAEHPNYTLVPDGKNLVVEASEVDCIMQFPKEDGWYLGDSAHDIPSGKKVDSPDEKSRYLWRVENRVGPVLRDGDVDVYGYNWLGVYLIDGPSLCLGVVTESPEGGAPEKSEAPSKPKAVLEIAGITSDEIRALLKGFSREMGQFGEIVREDFFTNARKLEQVLRGATLKE